MPKVRRLTSAEMKKSPSERAALRKTPAATYPTRAVPLPPKTPFPTPGWKKPAQQGLEAKRARTGLSKEAVAKANASSLKRAQKSMSAQKIAAWKAKQSTGPKYRVGRAIPKRRGNA